MTITKSDIKRIFPRAESIEQEGGKQLFHVWNADGSAFILSYQTIIGYIFAGKTVLTTKKYSHTTACHKGIIKRQAHSVDEVSNADMFDKINNLKLGV